MDLFTYHFWGNISTNFNFLDVFTQVKSCMMVMMWVFVGIEGASMLSSRANKNLTLKGNYSSISRFINYLCFNFNDSLWTDE